MLRLLSQREKNIVERLYGLNGIKEQEHTEIGLVLHLSRERVRQIEVVAVSKMRSSNTNIRTPAHPQHQKLLRAERAGMGFIMSVEKTERALLLRSAGKTFREISTSLGASIPAVWRAIRKKGLPKVSKCKFVAPSRVDYECPACGRVRPLSRSAYQRHRRDSKALRGCSVSCGRRLQIAYSRESSVTSPSQSCPRK